MAGNRTPVSRVAGENSTTEPPILVTSSIFPAQSHIKYCIHVKNKDCIGGESHPGLPRGRREFYHWTTNACKVNNLPCTIIYKILHSCKKQRLHWRGIDPRSPAWQPRILPLNHQCLYRRQFTLHNHIKYCIHVTNKSCIRVESNPGLPHGRREFYHWTTNACNLNNIPFTITYKILHSC